MDERRVSDETADRAGRGTEKIDVEPRRTSQSPGKPRPGDLPPAGPHAEPALTNPDATPGAGALTPPGDPDDIDSTSG